MRYKLDNCIGQEDMQKFVGALAVAQSNKGLHYHVPFPQRNNGLRENLNGTTAIVLIDGDKLAEYIYDDGLGMQVENTIQIKS